MAPTRPLFGFSLAKANLIYHGLNRENGEKFAHCLLALGGRTQDSNRDAFTHIITARSDHKDVIVSLIMTVIFDLYIVFLCCNDSLITTAGHLFKL